MLRALTLGPHTDISPPSPSGPVSQGVVHDPRFELSILLVIMLNTGIQAQQSTPLLPRPCSRLR